MRYLSLLRGINVGGHKKIPMQDLRSMYESIGLRRVTSYIQSGNVLFDDDSNDSDKLKLKIQRAIRDQFGFDVPLILRTRGELDAILQSNPLAEVLAEGATNRLFVTFLDEPPGEDAQETLAQHTLDDEQLVVAGREVYFFCPGNYGKSKLSNNLIEKSLATRATTRNWRTVLKLHQLAS